VVSAEVIISNRLGMHARAAAVFVREASRFHSEVWLEKGGKKVNGKSIMGILTLAAAKGETLVVAAEGTDEDGAVRALVEIVSSGFGE